MNYWLQTKMYRCPACRAVYLHDKAYAHACFICPRRPSATSLIPCIRLQKTP